MSEHDPTHTRSPLVVPWWFLTTIYAGFAALGVASIVFGSPTLDLTTPHGYVLFWGVAVTLSGVGGIVGSSSPRRETLERWSATLLAAILLIWSLYAFVLLFVPGSTSRAQFTIIVFMIAALPAVRAAYLLRRSGVRHE